MFEQAGLATIALSSVRGQIEKVKPPRALHCNFPIGRPLGRPDDSEFQKKVIMAAFELLKEPAGPALKDYPEEIRDKADEPLACPLPPRQDESLPAAVDEALALRPAYERQLEKAGKTLVGRSVALEKIPDAVAAFVRVAEGTPWTESEMPGHPLSVAKDLLAYYEEAASGLSDHIPEARQTESWFYHKTEAGKAVLGAKKALKDAGEKFWFYLTPFTQN